MKLLDLKNKKIAILGLGIENQALVNFLLAKKIKCEITICDKRSKEELGDKYKKLVKTRRGAETHRSASVRWKLGEDFNKGLYEFDILFRSPGWPIGCPGIREAVRAKSQKSKVKSYLSSSMKLFMDLCPTRNIIGVTGTKGKGTTASLIYEILKRHGVETRRGASPQSRGASVHLGGNIGVAPFDFINKIKKNDWVVLELSSFQLEDMNVSPRIAVITNFSEDHLAAADPANPNFHKTMADYWRAKMNIARWQDDRGRLVVNKKLKVTLLRQGFGGQESQKSKGKGKIIYFDKSNLASGLVGEHNKENIAAAAVASRLAGASPDAIKKAVANFSGLEHRLEFAGKKNGITYYNDSFATAPSPAITALKSFPAPIVLIAGGADKGSSFKELAKEIKKRVKAVVLFAGQGSKRLKKELLSIGYNSGKIKIAGDMPAAVRFARAWAVSGDVVLMSPACASFGIFNNYKERGKLFKKEVDGLS